MGIKFKYAPGCTCCGTTTGPCAACNSGGPNNWSVTFAGVVPVSCSSTACSPFNGTFIMPFSAGSTFSAGNPINPCFPQSPSFECRYGLDNQGNTTGCLYNLRTFLTKCATGGTTSHSLTVVAQQVGTGLLATFKKPWTDDTPCNGLAAESIPALSITATSTAAGGTGACSWKVATCTVTSA